MNPGTARQTPPTSYSLFDLCDSLAMVESSRSRTFAVGYLTSFRSSPSCETTPAAIFVPPTSTPTAFTLRLTTLVDPVHAPLWTPRRTLNEHYIKTCSSCFAVFYLQRKQHNNVSHKRRG